MEDIRKIVSQFIQRPIKCKHIAYSKTEGGEEGKIFSRNKNKKGRNITCIHFNYNNTNKQIFTKYCNQIQEREDDQKNHRLRSIVIIEEVTLMYSSNTQSPKIST